MTGVRVVRADQMRVPAVSTPGMDRREAFDESASWAGTLQTSPGVVTGWHVHENHDSYIYVVTGAVTIESGPDGRDRIEAAAGDFVLIPRGLIHREGTDVGSTGVEAVLVRVGEGEPVTNVDGPEPA